MQPRDPRRLESAEFDLLVIGGGIQGLAIAYEGASRGLATALVEAADFGSAASFNHQKTAHGGLRALQTGRFDRALEGIRERRALARIAPWLLRPLPFLTGTYRSLTRNRAALRAAFAIDRTLGRRRNDGVPPELHLPPPKLLSRGVTLRFFPGIDPRGLTGGAQWYDYQMVESDRLTLAFAAAAERAGAVLANYVAAESALLDGGAVRGMVAHDRVTNDRIDVRARLTVNAAGAHAGTVMTMFGVSRPVPLLKAMNLVTAKPARELALAARTRGGRMLTLVPWRGRALVGTSHSATFASPDDSAVTAQEVEAFVREANEAFPALQLTAADVTLVHRGVVPAEPGRATPELRGTPEIRDHAGDGARGAMTVIGVKYTTARGVAERAVSRAARLLGRSIRRSRTDSTVLPGAGIGDHEAVVIEALRKHRFALEPAAISRIASLYAEAGARIVQLMAEEPALRAPAAAGCDATSAEVVHVIRGEMAVHLADVVVRRMGLGAAGHPGAHILGGIARVAAGELGWSEERTAAEIAAVDAFYELTGR
ncbi:MAG TPA: FAD-dependent oxidoreductase [Vicinamibacterales bacterium]|nr:FAD-dependent oxidoreductase [Vicinamibacterales bacterium]